MQHSELTYYKDIQSRNVNWLWYPYIPFGKITIIQGDPGEGKTTFVLSLLSILSNGDKLPCSDIHISGKAIYQNLEDDNADTIKPRLEKHGANCANICFIDKHDGHLSIDGNDLKWAVIESKAKILVLDPIQAFIGENIDINRANAVRPLMNKLKELAESTGCAVLLVGHLNKNSGGKVNYRGLGSIDFSAAARSILLIGRSASDENIRVLAHQKSNLGPVGSSLAFTLDNGKVEWLGEIDMSASELLSGGIQDKFVSKQEEATILLSELLSKGPITYNYNALISHGIPVEILNGKRIVQYLSGEGKIGIVPCFENPTDYFYGGFHDESVGEFINLPYKDNNKLVEATQWEPITIAKPKSRQV